MTVIAWDGKTLAADRQMTWSGMRSTVCKIRQLANGEVIAAEGDSCKAFEVMQWYAEGAVPEKWPKCQAQDSFARLVVARRKGWLVYYDYLPIEQAINDPFHAFGVGRDFAIGALAMGADAIRAVEIASKFHNECGLGVDSFEVPDVA